jgi:hypothetical protein
MAVEPMISEDELAMLDLSAEDAELVAAAMAEEEAARQAREDAFDSLARSVEKKFFARANRRTLKETQWRKAMELYLGNLSVQDFAEGDLPFTEVTKQSNRPYYNLVANKCDIAIAQSVDMQFAGGEKNWSLQASITEDNPVEIEGARRMEKVIQAQLERCAYGRKSRRAIEDRVILGTGILKGPVNTGKVYTQYVQLEDGVTWVPQPAVDRQPAIEWVNPWFFFPDDSVNEFCRVDNTIEVHPSSPMQLKKWMSHPGFIREALEEALKTAPEAYLNDSYSDFGHVTTSNPYLFEDKYMVLEYHGPISQTDLEALSVEAPAYDPINEEYYGEVWVCAGKVIRIELENIEASFEVPYALSTWKKDPASVFGFGSPLLMKDAQRVARETWRMILDNASLSSGPQVALHRTYVEPANGSWVLNPGKAWNLLDSAVDVQKAIQFFNVPNMTASLMPILDTARGMAEEESMTPLLAGGLQGQEVSESATGQLMMREASTTVLDFLSEDWDDNITEKLIRRMYGWNMQYNPNPAIKGNYGVDVRTSTEYKNKQMYIRDLERLSMETKQDPEMAMVINREELTRARLAVMHLPSAALVRTAEEIEALKAEQANQPDPGMMELQIKQQEIQMKSRELDLKEANLQFELQQQQQREAWDHEERMMANQARMMEAQAAILKVQTEKEIKFLELALRSEDSAQQAQIKREIAIENDATKKFIASSAAQAKARDQMLTIEEMKLKNIHGTGI